MRLPWTNSFALLLLLALLVLTSLNTFVLGGFVGKVVALHPELKQLQERQSSKVLVAANFITALLALFALCAVAMRTGWQAYKFYAAQRGCDLSASSD